MPPFQVDWYWAVIGALSAYLLGAAQTHRKLNKFADTVVTRTVTSLRPAAPSPPPIPIQFPTPQPRRRRTTADRDRDRRPKPTDDDDDDHEG